MEGDRQSEGEAERQIAPPRRAQEQEEPRHPRHHAEHGGHGEGVAEPIEPERLGDPDERAARLGARGQDRLERGPGDRGHDRLHQEPRHGRHDGRPRRPPAGRLHVAADASTQSPLGCSRWRVSGKARARDSSSRSVPSASTRCSPG
jgi:hypothetical protein